MKPTLKLRHVWRTINDGTSDVRVLALQQWWQDETCSIDEHGVSCDHSGWRDVEIEHNEAAEAKWKK